MRRATLLDVGISTPWKGGAVVALASFVCALGCGGTTRTGVATSEGGAQGSGGALGAGGTREGNGGGNNINVPVAAGGTDSPNDCPGACPGASLTIEPLPVDLYVVLDQSSSMGDLLPGGGGTLWSVSLLALAGFAGHARSAGLGLGIQYFPLAGDAATSCDGSYERPDVELALLPGNVPALTASMKAHLPTTSERPTGPALQGALDHMKTWAAMHPGRSPAVVLVTSGFATACEPQATTDIALLAKTAYETEPRIRTFVIGLNLGSRGRDLDAIASVGGTHEAMLVDGGDVGTALTDALLSVRGQGSGCLLDLPKPRNPPLVPELVIVRYTPKATGVLQYLEKLNGPGDCAPAGGQGWYFDSPDSPTNIEVCPGSCSTLDLGTVEVELGCHPIACIPK